MWKDAARLCRRGTVAIALGAATAVLGAGSAAAATHTLHVSAGGSDANPCTAAKPCRTIGHAVSVAVAGDKISVSRGTYPGGVTVPIRLKLVGHGWPVVDASGTDNGFLLVGAGAAGSQVRGFVVRDATAEGILAMQTWNVTIAGNVVRHNDLGAFEPNPTNPECMASGQVPGDCGEGIHLMTVTGARVSGNLATGNTGGILLTDEFGPTAHNRVTGNRVVRNLYDCGITIAGHNPGAVNGGVPQPSVAGIYDNWIVGNVSNGNGTRGEGAGILLAAGAPTAGVYSNHIVGNTAKNNSLAGVTIHEHAPGGDLNGNVIVGNRLSRNALGAPGISGPGDPDAGVTHTTDILVFSAVDRITGTVIRHNWIRNAYFGVWTMNVNHVSAHANHFRRVHVHVHQQ
jgi:nitrous oxidase accessory protein NosD